MSSKSFIHGYPEPHKTFDVISSELIDIKRMGVFEKDHGAYNVVDIWANFGYSLSPS